MDKRRWVIPIVASATLALGFALHYLRDAQRSTGEYGTEPLAPALAGEKQRLLHQRFQQAVALLQRGEYDYAVQGFHSVLEVAPDLPEAHVNMGFAFLGLGEYEVARSFFDSASNLRPTLSNAYYGLAVAWEGLGDLGQAAAAMKAFVHIADENDAHLRRAQAAIWEWEAAMAVRENE